MPEASSTMMPWMDGQGEGHTRDGAEEDALGPPTRAGFASHWWPASPPLPAGGWQQHAVAAARIHTLWAELSGRETPGCAHMHTHAHPCASSTQSGAVRPACARCRQVQGPTSIAQWSLGVDTAPGTHHVGFILHPSAPLEHKVPQRPAVAQLLYDVQPPVLRAGGGAGAGRRIGARAAARGY